MNPRWPPRAQSSTSTEWFLVRGTQRAGMNGSSSAEMSRSGTFTRSTKLALGLVPGAADQRREVAGLCGMIGAHEAVHVSRAAAEVERQRAPAAGARLSEKAADVMRRARSFEPMEREQQGRVAMPGHAIDV